MSALLDDPSLRLSLLVCAGLALGCWLLSVITREYSWVDRLWSIVPPIYVGLFAHADGWSPRMLVLFVLTAAWGARLTFNFARKGGYGILLGKKGGEDYRWEVLRGRMSPAAFQVFNVFFIAGYQHLLLWLIALPAWAARGGSPLGAADGAIALAFAGLLVLETIADEQQWRFQEDKRQRKERGEPIERPFLTTGLFRFSRHPNFFAEQGMWWCVYLFAVAAGAGWLNPTLLGPVLLTLLFQGSTGFTEAITLGRYPSYADYQKTTSRLVPMPPRG
jgi:steroid 5-alpha reductase family enzyme